jgi:hypothetical protein
MRVLLYVFFMFLFIYLFGVLIFSSTNMIPLCEVLLRKLRVLHCLNTCNLCYDMSTSRDLLQN